jgi:hypothetical protein
MRTAGGIDGTIVYRFVIGGTCAAIGAAVFLERSLVAIGLIGVLAIVLGKDRQYRAKRLHGYRRKRRHRARPNDA